MNRVSASWCVWGRGLPSGPPSPHPVLWPPVRGADWRAPRKPWVCVHGGSSAPHSLSSAWTPGFVEMLPLPFSAHPSPAEVLVLARYRAQTEDELSLAPGDVVRQVHAGPARGWLRGELGDRSGLFPKHLVQEIPEALRGVSTPRPRCARSHPAKSRGPQRWCKVNFDYSPKQTDELTLQTGEIMEVIKEIEDGWWLGQKNGHLGAFPSNFVELLDSGPPSLGNTDMPSTSPDSQRLSKLSNLTYDSPPDYLQTETCRVLFDYQPEAPDELALHKGDLVKVLRKTTEDKGWWEGECQGRRGVFPDNFVLPPPPVRKLVPRKILSRESVLSKEPKKLVPKTSLPTVKKLATAASMPSKAKTSSSPSWDGQTRRESGCNGLNGGLRQPERKQSRIQASRRSMSRQKEEQSSLAKAPSRNKTSTPEKTLLPDKGPEKMPSPDRVSTPGKMPNLEEEGPTPEKALDSVRIPTAENSTMNEAPALEAPPMDEAKALTLISTPEQMLSEEVPPRDNTQCQHSSQAETLQGSESSVDTRAQTPKDIHMPGESPQLPNTSERCCCKVKQRDSSLPQSKAVCGSLGKEPTTLLKGEPAKDETILQEEAPSKEETLLKEVPPKELPSKGVARKKQVPPKEAAPTPQVAHSTQQMADPQETPTVQPSVPTNSSQNENDGMDVTSLREEVETLKSAIEHLGLQLEKKISDIWEELKTEREKRQLLEVGGVRTQEGGRYLAARSLTPSPD
ncbi:SH3 domain-containing protein 21 isoform X3 [Nannospalax galili]|uniref:SH3 domain-containing protein 21 isoform X3 n=1 Tax=Nannospalax galili TaxID=1026970 RepID=UPI00111C1B24|nr:SH3 domain-containing protein 21 isoform X3 [Nannospalax galili]